MEEGQDLKVTVASLHSNHQSRMERGGHGLPKVLLRPTLPYRSMPCGEASPETASWPAHEAGGQRLSYTLLDTPWRTPICRSEGIRGSTILSLRVFLTGTFRVRH
jgi:hypothetical protein